MHVEVLDYFDLAQFSRDALDHEQLHIAKFPTLSFNKRLYLLEASSAYPIKPPWT